MFIGKAGLAGVLLAGCMALGELALAHLEQVPASIWLDVSFIGVPLVVIIVMTRLANRDPQ